MKQFRMTGTVLKTLVFAGLLAACNHDEMVTPSEQVKNGISDQKAKISSALRLINDNGHTIQYVKSGKFSGQISRVNEAPWAGFYLTYTYDDSNPSGELIVRRKKYKSATNSFTEEERFKIVNGLCTMSENDFGSAYEYKYTPQGYLDEVKFFHNGALMESWKYKYGYDLVNQVYRLTDIERKKNGSPWINYHFTYKSTQDQYPLNNPLNTENGKVDRYLPFFGKKVDRLLESITELDLTTNKSVTTFYTNYITDSDGLVSSRERIKSSAVSLETFAYSTNWQGI